MCIRDSLYIERVNPDNPNQYEYMGEWRDFNVIEEVIKVNGGEDVVLTVRETLHGPVISDVLDDQPDVLALRWTAGSGPSRILQSVLSINQAPVSYTHLDVYKRQGTRRIILTGHLPLDK